MSRLKILDYFQNIKDPRDEARIEHPFEVLLGIGICAVLCGYSGWEAMAEFGRYWSSFLGRYLDLSQGVPTDDTFSRLFRRLSPFELMSCFERLSKALKEQVHDLIALDGKTLCGSQDRPCGTDALHIVSAWSVTQKQVLCLQGAPGKGHEIALIKMILTHLDVKDRLITIDAIGCQKEICQQILEGEGHYLIALKKNQPTLYKDVCLLFHERENHPLLPGEGHNHVDAAHGRIETRQARVIHDVAWLQQEHQWPGLKAVGRITATREEKGRVSQETRYYILSQPLTAERFNACVRGHWGIENTQHYVLDETLGEDRSRIRKDQSPMNMAILKRFALNILTLAQTSLPTKSIASLQRRATADRTFLASLLQLNL